MEAVIRRCKIAATTFHITSTSPIPQYYCLPFGIITTACHVASSANSSSRNAVCMISTRFSQCVSPSSPSVVPSPFSAARYSLLDAASHPFRCSARIPEGPLDLFLRIFLTASSISSSVGTESSTFTGRTVTGMFSPGDGT